MLYGDDREAMRQVFYHAWEKAKSGQMLTALESQVVDVIQLHPEYHGILEGKERIVETDPSPFLHLGLHLAIRDQVHLDKPPGIQKIFQQLLQLGWPSLEIEHKMMACLSKTMWDAQQNKRALDEAQYQALLVALLKQ